jgi:hypothetical protein
MKQHPLFLEGGRVDVGDVVAYRLHVRLLGAKARNSGVERVHQSH